MSRSVFVVLLIGAAAPFLSPAYAEDYGSAQAMVQPVAGGAELSAQTMQADVYVCPTIGVGDTAGTIDCEVNQALSARSQNSASVSPD